MLALATGLGIAQDRPSTEEWVVDPMRGPTDLGLTDPSLVGAIDVHVHLDPDSPGTRGIVRAVDLFDAAKIAIARGMRGFVYKTHQDAGSASGAHLIRRHVSPTFEAFGRIASNYATGGINVAAVEHFGQIKGGWGRIIEMPTRDAVTSSTPFAAKDPAALKAARPWMLMMPPDTPPFVAVSKDGELLPVVKHLIGVMAKMRTINLRGAMVLATGHATPEEHLLLAREGRAQGLQVLLTHPGNIPQLPEAAKLGAFVEIVTTQIYRTPAGAAAVRRTDPQDRRRAHYHLDRLRPDHQPLSERLSRGFGARVARARHHAARDRSDVQGQPGEAIGPAAASGLCGGEAVGARSCVGWVERSETHRFSRLQTMGFA